ncbi:tRNA (guanosine(37)-N1)-methyltransferase TrmD [Desulfopila inferna]|uniref:tRNA (guanosine(37)-N1)-methyltransferase TrmD n=1 Tax=Desulfopila inferna TaxID=468528 RepID=UPI0019624230|nr:tRNA (guanosine(37)-N1)-methyltransferase TrmD [Desulfopila inferna]MBM9604309.1 tRNA (guanosine(37)-N1)-methyltransferase TrmD [Desulfopila inferna]
MIFDILTIFPDFFQSPLEESILRRARDKGSIEVHITNIRDFAFDKHAMTDDRPFGGGEGMVMKAEPLAAALQSIEKVIDTPRVILLSPQGRAFTQEVAGELAAEPQLIMICGRYEGVDERFRQHYVSDEISIGDYILTGGELAALIVIDAVTRLLPGVLGCAASAEKDTFSRNLLKHPQYTRPREFEGLAVPEDLLSGDHQRIEEYRFIASIRQTLAKRPELLARETFSKSEIKLLKKNELYAPIEEIRKGRIS